MFARLFLCDLFIHGIGGAKYDQMTDAIIERFFGFAPPDYLTVTATAKLPIMEGTRVRVIGVENLVLEVEPLSQGLAKK